MPSTRARQTTSVSLNAPSPRSPRTSASFTSAPPTSAAGAAPIVITDLDANRLAKARELIPRVRTLQVERGESAHALGGRIVRALGQEAKLVSECTGIESSVHAGIYATRFGGMVLVIGFQYRYHDIYPKSMALVAAGLVDLESSVSHQFRLGEEIRAFETASNPGSGAI
ncbi:uncharacterized protein BO97DRAFT_421979 [Aspergillus homomorphus CBS 101889]|uniref:Uncharacterized protein n=1 Tax=Aspergillus homomorphus (strain CBS 101889) TaxID=1450537 RepID=A0A395I7Z7_ASPHC|nr:hypothetical protein BO97DRAFT_421979 [Aspergillus homomorphus CBS 101889]RAL15188.1 hypothetical protein BO97DRAFT_421979 [Aspergillus homomorphus CBS 101889]